MTYLFQFYVNAPIFNDYFYAKSSLDKNKQLI